MEKITNVKALETTIATLKTVENFDSEVIEKLEKIKAQFEKKSSTLRKPTATQVANEGIKAEILEVMEADTNYTVSDLVALLDNRFSNQKLSALLKALVNSNEIARIEDKRKTYFVKAS